MAECPACDHEIGNRRECRHCGWEHEELTPMEHLERARESLRRGSPMGRSETKETTT